MILLNAIRRFLAPLDRPTVIDSANRITDWFERERAEDRFRRIWLIENRQASLRHEIEAARKAKRARRHLYAEQERLTRELLTLERAG